MSEVFQQPETEDKLEGIIKPLIYSKRAIWGFSIFFTPLFGGILLMQNLKDIDRKKEANLVLILSILWTIFTSIIIVVFKLNTRVLSYGCNIVGAAILTEYFYKKYFPEEADYEKKKIWTPLIIGVLICLAFILVVFLGRDKVV